MAVTLRQTEEIPASYPTVSGLSDAAQVLDAAALWQRIEAYCAHRWTARGVVWIVEGAGDWQPPLTPATLDTVEEWQAGEWVAFTPGASPFGGYDLRGCGPYRITATVGGGDLPAAVSEAFRRLAEYLATAPAPTGASAQTVTVGQLSEAVTLTPSHIARAMQFSGAADLLRAYRRA
ncbi:hypothetical protein DL1_16615 [Thioclava dalianensis]|uniref:Uncharacterized protein n=1 Tax=Thioclava dalianensis TaxID=1185766 RepID=A0A074U019_9RHOB|nr:hypothetical protein [Thioclava dalianensis]KEP68027.1 hypothetical protein DL1_16615 [Thioclava dalianensis]SFN61669.1 hypothetical protein SAMN05216224_10813 [Thioclava dalianensis]